MGFISVYFSNVLMTQRGRYSATAREGEKGGGGVKTL